LSRTTSTRCVLTPEAPGSENNNNDTAKKNAWARVTPEGVMDAKEIWAKARNSMGNGSADRHGEWEGRSDRPVEQVFASDVLYSPKKHKFFDRAWSNEDKIYGTFIAVTHLFCLAAPFTFTWANFALFIGGWVVTGMLGITLSYHRQLAHKSFKTPKWLEYAFAYCGVQAVQGDPIEWVSSHRYHHLNCDTPKDPHTPYEGFWHSHAGWFLDSEATQARVADRSNASDMMSQPFYVHMQKHYGLHIAAGIVAYLALGGFGGFVWGFCMRTCWVHHITWFVNSACHVWGYQTYNTGDLSRNNWWVGILAFGEGWHNNHHAFEYSARHGLEWWQIDMTYMTIQLLSFLGLAKKIRLPNQSQLDRMAVEPKTQTATQRAYGM